MAEQVRLGHTEMHPEQSSHLFCQVPMHELARGGFFAHSKERPLSVISQEYLLWGTKTSDPLGVSLLHCQKQLLRYSYRLVNLVQIPCWP